MSKDLFLAMREQEIATNNFLPTKKEIIANSRKFAKDIFNSGEHNPQELYSQALRLKETLTEIEKTLKTLLPEEDFEAFGIKAQYRDGGKTLNYADDPVYADLQKQLKNRAELLKTAYNSESEIYDSEGVEIPKVGITYRKSGLTILY